jgi:hypothetical protein
MGIADQCTGQWFSRQNRAPKFNNILGQKRVTENSDRKEDGKKKMLTMVVMVKVTN